MLAKGISREMDLCLSLIYYWRRGALYRKELNGFVQVRGKFMDEYLPVSYDATIVNNPKHSFSIFHHHIVSRYQTYRVTKTLKNIRNHPSHTTEEPSSLRADASVEDPDTLLCGLNHNTLHVNEASADILSGKTVLYCRVGPRLLSSEVRSHQDRSSCVPA